MKMSSKPKPEDDIEEGGDLGLGRGLKPGALEVNSNENVANQFTMLVKAPTPTLLHQHRHSVGSENGMTDHFEIAPRSRRNSMFKLKFIGKSKSEVQEGHDGHEEYPAFAEIPLGTSIRQQKKLFEEKMNELCIGDVKFELDTVREIVTEGEQKESHHIKENKANTAIQRKLKKAEMEIGILRQDLELCQKQLEAKYKAIVILQKQSFAVHTQQSDQTKAAKRITRSLQKSAAEHGQRVDTEHRMKALDDEFSQELNKLQFKLEYNQETLMGSQELWSERFDRVCLENSALMATLEARSDEMRKLGNEKMALQRERDELLALLDIQERQRYEFSCASSVSSEDSTYNGLTSTELAVLGACHCQIQTPDPCRCAFNAAALKRDLANLKEQLETCKQQREEALVTTDAYRIAFEEQLARNRGLMRQISELTNSLGPPQTRSSKVKATLKWIIQQLNEEESVMELARQLSMQNASASNSSGSTPSDTKYPSGILSPVEQPYVPNKEEIMSGLQHSFGELHTGPIPCTPDHQARTKYVDQNSSRKTSWQQIASKSAPQTFINVIEPTISDPQDHVVNCHQDNEETRYSGNTDDVPHQSSRKKKLNRENSVKENKCDRTVTADAAPSKELHQTGKQRGSETDISAGSASVQNGADYVNNLAMEPLPGTMLVSNETRIDGLLNTLSASSEKDLLATLIEMISDRSEALAHQRLAARMLAVRTQELERKLQAAHYHEDVFHPQAEDIS